MSSHCKLNINPIMKNLFTFYIVGSKSIAYHSLLDVRFRHARLHIDFAITPLHNVKNSILVHGCASLHHDRSGVGCIVKFSKAPVRESESAKDGLVGFQGGRAGFDASAAFLQHCNICLTAVVVSCDQPIDVGIAIVSDFGPD